MRCVPFPHPDFLEFRSNLIGYLLRPHLIAFECAAMSILERSPLLTTLMSVDIRCCLTRLCAAPAAPAAPVAASWSPWFPPYTISLAAYGFPPISSHGPPMDLMVCIIILFYIFFIISSLLVFSRHVHAGPADLGLDVWPAPRTSGLVFGRPTQYTTCTTARTRKRSWPGKKQKKRQQSYPGLKRPWLRPLQI